MTWPLIIQQERAIWYPFTLATEKGNVDRWYEAPWNKDFFWKGDVVTVVYVFYMLNWMTWARITVILVCTVLLPKWFCNTVAKYISRSRGQGFQWYIIKITSGSLYILFYTQNTWAKHCWCTDVRTCHVGVQMTKAKSFSKLDDFDEFTDLCLYSI